MADASPPSSGTSSKTGSGFTRKVGPLPLWGWAVIGFGVYWYISHRTSAASGTGTGTGAAGNRSLKIGNITLTQTGGRGRGGGGGRDVDKTDIDKHPGTGGPPPRKPPQKCPKGYFWDPDDNGGKGRCVKIAGHKGPDRPGSDSAAIAGGTPIKGPGGTGHEPTPTRKPLPTPGPRINRTRTTGGQGTTGSQQVIIIPPEGQQTGQAVNAQTGAPVYEEWAHAHRGPQVPPPIEAYAPGTNGATYGPAAASAAVDIASSG